MRYRNSAGLAVAAAAMALSVSACQSSDSTAPAATSAVTSAQQSASATASAAPDAEAAAPCRTADLSARLGAQTKVPVDVQGELGAAGTHYKLPLVFTNHSAHACVLSGFPGVDLVGSGSTYSLPRSGTP